MRGADRVGRVDIIMPLCHTYGMTTKRILLAALMCASACMGQTSQGYATEAIFGTTHVIWLRGSTATVIAVEHQGVDPRQYLWLNLHSDDRLTGAFRVIIRYKDTASGKMFSITRTITNDMNLNGGQGYWVSDPSQCIFWIGWPDVLSYSIVEEKAPTEFVDVS